MASARIATGVLMVQLAKLLGQGILGGDGINSGFDRVTHWSGPDVWCLALGYGLQLFLDFAGYSHIAIGAAKALGFTVPENFARPFQSTNASIFWTRWHMSLSFWIRDYIFLPLATLRREVWWRNLALVISMVLFGLWHKPVAVSGCGAVITECSWFCTGKCSKWRQVQLESARERMELALMARDHGAHQPGMDFVPRQFSDAGGSDVLGHRVAAQLCLAFSEWEPVFPGGALGAGYVLFS